jgi:hypothetical protein
MNSVKRKTSLADEAVQLAPIESTRERFPVHFRVAAPDEFDATLAAD